jgi:hypothetical protein
LAHKEQQEVHPTQDLLVLKDIQVHKVALVLKEQQVFRLTLELLALKVKMVLQAHKVSQVHKVLMVLKVTLVTQELKDLLVVL